MSYREDLKAAYFHAKESARSLQRAASVLDVDLDTEPLQESGAPPVPGDGDISGDDDLGEVLPGGKPVPNPQAERSRHLRLVGCGAKAARI
jgi:hypothetical protein